MRHDPLGLVLPVWVNPLLLAIAAFALVWGSRFVPVQGSADKIGMLGIVCAFFAVRGIWGLPGVVR